jgi:hypothetical protein
MYLTGMLVVVCLLLGGCGGGSPTATNVPTPAPTSRHLVVQGGVTAVTGGVIEVAILLDGQKIPSSHPPCLLGGGCVALAVTTTSEVVVSPGQHTVAFQIVRQSSAAKQTYTTFGNAVIATTGGTQQTITLSQRTETVGVGEAITYQITVN